MKKSMAQASEIIYIIDDDVDDIEILMELIKQIKPESICLGYQNPEDILTAVKATVPHYIFLSIDLPKIRGDKFLQELRQVNELDDTYIVVQIIDLTTDIEEMLLSHGADIAIEKPWSVEDYREILKNIFR
jgi:response regulator RpfG family c-di-GMP phosphodiesterase